MANFFVRSNSGNELGRFEKKSGAVEYARQSYIIDSQHAEVVHAGTGMIVYRTSEHIAYLDQLRRKLD